YSKMRVDLSYAFSNGANLRVSSTSYGANNSFGRSGFTLFDGALVLPVNQVKVTLGATNILGLDNYATGGLYYGGYTYKALPGSTDSSGNPVLFGPTNYEYATPRTVFLQFSAAVGH
ncbi:MAG: hypothetical protein WA629_08280, partial [Candidatus Aquilonibacter sp.]